MDATLEALHVLVVEDDPTIADVLVRYLERERCVVTWAADGREAIDHVAADLPDVVVLDLLLPHVDGFTVLDEVRARGPVPVIVVSARGDEANRVLGLELGADDYLGKPFSPRELVARVRALVRRASEPLRFAPGRGATRIECGDLEIDVLAHEVRRRGEIVALTAREFDLLAHLAQHPRVVFRREQLLESVWGFTYGDASTVTVHIRRLREKIEDDPSHPQHVVTVWGQGYRWDG
jgi:DNA-binding response OmpR family regulator